MKQKSMLFLPGCYKAQDLDPALRPRIQNCVDGVRDKGLSWEPLHRVLRREAGQVYIPTLKFTASERKTKKQKGTLLAMELPRVYHVKVVRILQRNPEHVTLNVVHYPGPTQKILPGDECWILPILKSPVPVDPRCSCEAQLHNAFHDMYTSNEAAGEAGFVNIVDAKLDEFMQVYSTNHKAELDWLPVCCYEYPSKDASPAAICAIEQANSILDFVAQQPRRLWYWFLVQRNLQFFLRLRFMNMRHTYRVSPVAVIHGKDLPDRPVVGVWEIPERCTTVVFPGDYKAYYGA